MDVITSGTNLKNNLFGSNMSILIYPNPHNHLRQVVDTGQVRRVSKSSRVVGVKLEIYRARIGTFLARRPNVMVS
jgi:hypothetical protein